MEDKEVIIIDGVNVENCECFYTSLLPFGNNDKKCCYPFNNRLCQNNPNCYYKQLKLKEQECEKLEKREYENLKLIRDYFNRVRYLDCKLDRYKQALEKIEKHCLKCTNEKFSLQDFINAKDEELTEKGQTERDILKIIKDVKDDNR